ncbi:MAG: hypothetical protein NC215_00485 [Ruminococcus sp.]|nr:hypothetical protein [Ruminococcus sp.]MCM1391773.1 hypothetical protein [Ruminococcus sp.]
MNFMSFIGGYITGAIAIGIVIAIFIWKSKSIGSLRIDRSEPDEPPCLFLEFHDALSIISNKRYVILEVKNEDFITHK